MRLERYVAADGAGARRRFRGRNYDGDGLTLVRRKSAAPHETGGTGIPVRRGDEAFTTTDPSPRAPYILRSPVGRVPDLG